MQRTFSLQSVLHLRQFTEELQQRSMIEAQQRLLCEEDQLASLRNMLSESIAEAAQHQRQAVLDVALVGMHVEFTQWMQKQVRAQEYHVEQLSSRAVQARNALVQATKERKTIESLAEKHSQMYQAWQDRLEQAMLDEVAGQMHERQRK